MTSRSDEPALVRRWKIRVRLVVTDYPGTLDELTHQIGVLPDRSLPAGEPIAPGKVSKADRWVIDAGNDDELSLEEQLRALLERVSHLAPRLSGLPPPTSVMVSCGILDYTRDVSLYFEPNAISALAEMNAALDVDYYDMSSTGKDEPNHSDE